MATIRSCLISPVQWNECLRKTTNDCLFGCGCLNTFKGDVEVKDNPFSLVVNVENAVCVVEFDVIGDSEINYETWEVFYNKDFKGDLKQVLNPYEWVLVNDLIHDETWVSIEEQIREQWKDVEEQQRAYDESY